MYLCKFLIKGLVASILCILSLQEKFADNLHLQECQQASVPGNIHVHKSFGLPLEVFSGFEWQHKGKWAKLRIQNSTQREVDLKYNHFLMEMCRLGLGDQDCKLNELCDFCTLLGNIPSETIPFTSQGSLKHLMIC